jgi:hypothetical protein
MTLTAAAASPRYPDFYIVGAPRCGTTFMYEYLRQHPQIFMPDNKEPNFMCSDLDSGSYLDGLSFMRDDAAYRALFRDAPAGALTGEASTWYLYSESAAARIRHLRPDARIIIMLRDPVQMLYSLHGRRVYGGSEDLTEFADALDAEADRREGRRISPRARNVKALFYRDVGSYSRQVERYLDTFPAEQVRVIIFEEFIKDVATAYTDTLRFLGVDTGVHPTFEVVNAGVERRSQRLRQLMLTPIVVRLAKAVIPPRLRPRVGPIVDALTSKELHRPPLDAAVRTRLQGELRSDVRRLDAVLGRNVSAIWGY